MTSSHSPKPDSSLVKSGSYINGNWLSDSENTFAVLNPASGEEIAMISSASAADATLAVDAASSALWSWRNKTAKERSSLLRCWFDLVMQNKEDLGKPFEYEIDDVLDDLLFLYVFILVENIIADVRNLKPCHFHRISVATC
jgi:delta 1-pyrroline-5-carboxylate dehydrogenase